MHPYFPLSLNLLLLSQFAGCESESCSLKQWFYSGVEQRACAHPYGYDGLDGLNYVSGSSGYNLCICTGKY